MADVEKEPQKTPSETPETQEESSESEFECTVDIQDNGPWKKKISVTVGRAQIDKQFDQEYRELIRTAEVPGFRKGRAPRRLVEKRYGQDVTNQAKLRLLAQAFEKIEEEHDFEVLGEPDFDPEKIELPETGDLTFEYEIEIKPEFELPSLEGIRIEKSLFEINEERIDGALDDLRRRQGTSEEITDAPAQAEDMILADVTMNVEGVDEPETSDDQPIRVGATAVMGVMIEELPKLLEGAKIGQTKTCSAEVGDNHPNEDYRNKKADLTLVIKSIRRLKPAELNEAFFAALGVTDETELRKFLEDNLEAQADREVRSGMKDQVYKYLEENVEFELPAEAAARHADRVLARRYYELLQRGVSREQIDENMEQLRASTSEQAAHQLKMNFIMDSVGEKLEIEVSEPEINGWIAQIAGMYQRRPEKIRDEMQREGRLGELQNQIRDEKAIDKILEMAEVVDAPEKPKTEKPSTSKSTAAKTKKKTTKKKVKRKAPQSDKE